MGLDTVEFIMGIEDEFGIVIEDKDAAKLALLGDIHTYIVQALRKRGVAPDEEQVWQRFSALVIEHLGAKPEEVIRSAHIVYDLGAD